jgi:hypothetical protein
MSSSAIPYSIHVDLNILSILAMSDKPERVFSGA